MSTSFDKKLGRACHAATFDAHDGLTLTFGHATDNISAAADLAVEQHYEASSKPSIFRAPR